MTPVEADITCRLATGQTIDEIAEQRSSKSRTIRGYLKAIFVKTGVSRQADLISLVLNAPLQVTDAKKIVMQYGKDGLVKLPEKNISYREYGPKNGRPMVLCHASLSCRYGVPLHLPLLEKYQIRLIVPERGGVGLSNGAPYQKITDFAADFRALVEHLQLKKVDVIGVVAGGAYALSAAWLCSDIVNRVLLLEGFAPNIAEHTIKGAPGYFRMMPRLIRYFPKVSERLMSFQLRDFANDWQKALQHTSKLFNPFDAQILLREDVRDFALIEAIENNRQGVSALIRDILLVHADWQIPLEDIKSPCYIAYGNADPVAACYAETLIQRLPNTRQVFREDEGFARMLYLSFFEIIEQAGWVEVKSENLPAEKVGDGNLYPA
ncbi:alpha/beta hydrolase [Pelagibaculum spongiae]|uniref:HTH luxR-type domain-containing protein n=1 Tax=Pelagibaculum spongiae TaxID=2080658 RepID=A0A2V1H478_9GAMM|nr:alpha/beta hydrolase [Pelagibaculum spongiae]PVZ71997.1 hypothetical protein DC094_02960 [Pelagibaculum spongiae]